MSSIPAETLQKIERHFHAVIRSRAAALVERHGLELPHLSDLLKRSDRKAFLRVPGMYGGFSCWLEREGEDTVLISESWCRIVGGSGERHEVTSDGSRLVEEGFV